MARWKGCAAAATMCLAVMLAGCGGGPSNNPANNAANATNAATTGGPAASSGPDSGGGAGGAGATPASTADASGPSRFCDCEHLDAGILTREWQKACLQTDAAMRQATSNCGNDQSCIRQALKATDDGAKFTGGQLCDPSMSGPAAWPATGGPLSPPANPGPPGKPCNQVSGLSRNCVQ